MENIKDCPFCGKQPVIKEYNGGFAAISCSCFFAPHAFGLPSREAAIEKWNDRDPTYLAGYKDGKAFARKDVCTVTEYPTGESGVACFSCNECHYGWHISINDKPFTYCPNCGAKVAS